MREADAAFDDGARLCGFEIEREIVFYAVRRLADFEGAGVAESGEGEEDRVLVLL